jgi:hypothetical protein
MIFDLVSCSHEFLCQDSVKSMLSLQSQAVLPKLVALSLKMCPVKMKMVFLMVRVFEHVA